MELILKLYSVDTIRQGLAGCTVSLWFESGVTLFGRDRPVCTKRFLHVLYFKPFEQLEDSVLLMEIVVY